MSEHNWLLKRSRTVNGAKATRCGTYDEPAALGIDEDPMPVFTSSVTIARHLFHFNEAGQ